MITISLCMIVKNEEKLLARCLDSVACLMDEIVIVDTSVHINEHFPVPVLPAEGPAHADPVCCRPGQICHMLSDPDNHIPVFPSDGHKSQVAVPPAVPVINPRHA